MTLLLLCSFPEKKVAVPAFAAIECACDENLEQGTGRTNIFRASSFFFFYPSLVLI
jgi:hypothetical protein